MKIFAKIYIIAVIVSLCVGCAGSATATNNDFDSVIYEPDYATGFSIMANEEGATLVRITRPWQGEALQEQTLAIFPSREMTEGYEGQYIVGPARRVVCMSTSHIAMLDVIGRVDAVVGVSGKQYVMNEAIAANASVRDVGYDSNLDYETLVMLRPDVVLMYGVTAENTAVTSKLRELGIPYLYVGDYTEQSPLGKAEVLVALAEIVGCRERGVEVFEDIVARYEAVRREVCDGAKPKVMFNLPYQDVWYMPSDDSYMVRLVEDAGGEYIYKGENPTGGSRGISLEEALMLVNRTDIWLNVGQCRTLDELRVAAPHFMTSGVVQRGAVYNNNLRQSPAGGSDFWESAIVHPDVVLSDMVDIIRGDTDSLYYHRRLM